VKFILLLFISFISLQNFARDSTATPKFSNERLDAFKNDRDFAYHHYKVNQTDIYDTLGNYLLRFLSKIFGSRAAELVFGNFKYIILFFAVLVIILYFRKIVFKSVFQSQQSQSNHSFKTEELPINEIDFIKLITEAKQQGNYPLALRFLYLQMLQSLSNAGLINWQIHKTNFEYFLEIKRPDQQQQFRQLTMLFESVWYGATKLSQQEFAEVEAEFEKMIL
jgi:hypothetical protein